MPRPQQAWRRTRSRAAAAPADEKKKADEKEPKGKGKKVKEEDELFEEDQQIKSEMELLVTRVQDPELALRAAALQTMVKEIRTATSSMTSVPKPLKFLRPHYGTLKDAYKAGPTRPRSSLQTCCRCWP